MSDHPAVRPPDVVATPDADVLCAVCQQPIFSTAGGWQHK